MNLTLSIGKLSESLRCKHTNQYSILKLLIIGLLWLWICIRVQESFCGMNKKLFLCWRKRREVSGKEAVLRARQSLELGDAFHAYIIDWRLPDMNGEPSELKKEICLSSRQILRFFSGGRVLRIFIYTLMLLLFNGTSRNTKNYINYHRKM